MKKFLFIPEIPSGDNLLEKVCVQFQKVSLLNEDIQLLILLPQNISYHRYIDKFCNLTWSEAGATNSNRIRFETYDSQRIVSIPNLLSPGDCYITGNVRDVENDYLRQSLANHFEILTANEDNIFSNIKKSHARTEMEKEIIIFMTKLFARYSPSKYEYMLVHQGLGETMTLFYLLPEYIERTRKPLIIITFNDARKKLLELSPAVCQVINVPTHVYDYLALWVAPDYGWKNFLNLHYMELPYSSDVVFVDKIRGFLNLIPNNLFQPIHVNLPDNIIKSAQQWLLSHNLSPNKTVYLITQGFCFNTSALSHEFWVSLSNELISRGYDVVVNGSEEMLPGVHNAYLDITETAALSQLCTAVISVSTGLLDVFVFLSHNDLEIKLLLPDAHNAFWLNRPPVDDICKFGLLFPEHIVFRFKNWWRTKKNIESFLYNDDISCLAKRIADSIGNKSNRLNHI